jgi:hypothetical protein
MCLREGEWMRDSCCVEKGGSFIIGESEKTTYLKKSGSHDQITACIVRIYSGNERYGRRE